MTTTATRTRHAGTSAAARRIQSACDRLIASIAARACEGEAPLSDFAEEALLLAIKRDAAGISPGSARR